MTLPVWAGPAIAAGITAMLSPYFIKLWERFFGRDSARAQVKVARIHAEGRFQDRLLKRVEELEGRIGEIEEERQTTQSNYNRLKQEYQKVEYLATDLRSANENLNAENTSLRRIIVDLNTDVVDLRSSVDQLASELAKFSCQRPDCRMRMPMLPVVPGDEKQ